RRYSRDRAVADCRVIGLERLTLRPAGRACGREGEQDRCERDAAQARHWLRKHGLPPARAGSAISLSCPRRKRHAAAQPGGLEIYAIANNQITNAAFIGTVGFDWQFSGVGNFSGVPGETDLLLRNVNTGGLEVSLCICKSSREGGGTYRAVCGKRATL